MDLRGCQLDVLLVVVVVVIVVVGLCMCLIVCTVFITQPCYVCVVMSLDKEDNIHD